MGTAWVGCHDRRRPKWWCPCSRAPRPPRVVSRSTASAIRESVLRSCPLSPRWQLRVGGRALPRQTQAVAFNFSHLLASARLCCGYLHAPFNDVVMA